MPTFKGLAVSIHTPDGPLPEYSVQKHGRQGRITAYIPVPPPKVPTTSTSGIPEQSGFAVSITLLVPGQTVPYSTPKPTPENPRPLGKVVGQFTGMAAGRVGQAETTIAPYMPRTQSMHETLAAYIYFDGRAKEEVATLLRRSEETWVNSRWVSAEDGGIAEREFLFREVGLESWLNGLDLVGKEKEKAAKIEKRHRKLERQQRDQDASMDGVQLDDVDSPNDSDDEPPEAEAAGQIKIALFRVIASGEVKRGEYEPQFNADDDDGDADDGQGNAEIEHTTSLAKPKTLDPKTISTQTVTGLDPPDVPFAVFTFLYRSEKQLRKMGILEPKAGESSQSAAKRKSLDFSNLGPLNKFGTVGFTGYREQPPKAKKRASRDIEKMMSDSDADDDDEVRAGTQRDDEDAPVSPRNGAQASTLDSGKQGELSEGVRKIKLKRTFSTEQLEESRKSPHIHANASPSAGLTDVGTSNGSAAKGVSTAEGSLANPSPFKKHRPSTDDGNVTTNVSGIANGVSKLAEDNGAITEETIAPAAIPLPGPTKDEDGDEEL